MRFSTEDYDTLDLGVVLLLFLTSRFLVELFLLLRVYTRMEQIGDSYFVGEHLWREEENFLGVLRLRSGDLWVLRVRIGERERDLVRDAWRFRGERS